jgi:hypothetical protein
MSGKKRDKQNRAAKLREQISKLKSPEPSADENEPDMKPGESPKEYIERRIREGGFKKGTDEKRGDPESGR